MKILRRLWNDIQRGENIDLYVTILVAVSLVALSLFEIVPESWLTPVTLAVLSLIAMSLLRNRDQVQEVLEHLTLEPENLFYEKFPENLEADLKRAKDLWLIGVTLSRTIESNRPLLEEKLSRGDSIKVVLVDPEGIGVELTEMRKYGRANVELTREQIRRMLDELHDLKSTAPDKLQVRTVDYPISFGLFAIDPETPTGTIYVEHYPFKIGGDSRPKFVVHAHNTVWYEFFSRQIHTLWEHGKPQDQPTNE